MDVFETAKQHFFEGLQQLELNSLEGAEANFARALELIPDRPSTLNNLAAVKIKLKKFDEAEKLGRKLVAIEEKSPDAWANLGIALTALGRHEEALSACEQALNCDPGHLMSWLAKIMTLMDLKRFEDALAACDLALQIDPNQDEILYRKSLALKELNRPDEAQKYYLQSLDMKLAAAPIFIGKRFATQKAAALVISRYPDIEPSLRSFETLNRNCSNFVGQLDDRLQEDFHFSFAFLDIAMRPEVRERLARPDFIVSNHINAGILLHEPNLAGIIAFYDSFGVPVVNHPTKAIRTSRDESVKLLSDIPGAIIPKTLRFSAIGKTAQDLLPEIEARCNYPLITRSLTSQMGKGMTKVDNRAELIDVLSAGGLENFFVTEFVDSRSGSRFYRKLRAAVVQGQAIITRVDFHTHWNVHGRKQAKRVALYLENPNFLDEEKRIVLDPEGCLGKTTMQTLRVIAERVPLDVYGMDFDVDAQGRVIYYEANAAMNLFSTACVEVPNPPEGDEQLKQALQRYFGSLVGRR